MIDLTEKPAQPEYAGFWLRLVAHIIDEMILGIPTSIIVFTFILSMGLMSSMSDLANMDNTDKAVFAGSFIVIIMLAVFVSVILSWLYFAVMESSSKQATIGKMALGIKVTDIDGSRITFARATGRYFGKILSSMILHIGYIMAGFTPKKQALHDLVAECLVVKQ